MATEKEWFGSEYNTVDERSSLKNLKCIGKGKKAQEMLCDEPELEVSIWSWGWPGMLCHTSAQLAWDTISRIHKDLELSKLIAGSALLALHHAESLGLHTSQDRDFLESFMNKMVMDLFSFSACSAWKQQLLKQWHEVCLAATWKRYTFPFTVSWEVTINFKRGQTASVDENSVNHLCTLPCPVNGFPSLAGPEFSAPADLGYIRADLSHLDWTRNFGTW